jgi:hypothetical protein
MSIINTVFDKYLIMRKITFTLLLFSASFLNLKAQKKLNDVNRIVLNTYVPEQIEAFPSQAKSLLENKLSQISTNYGMGGSAINPRFVLMSNISVLSKDISPGPPQMTAMNLQVTLFIADAIDMKKYASTSIDVKGVGVGNNENKAYIDAIKNINVNNTEIKSFIEDGKSKIVDYYNTQCDFIIRDAMSLSKKGEYDAAMFKLAAVPDICENCYMKTMDTMQFVYQQKIDKECMLIMRNAKTTWIANQNAEGASKVAEIINSISPFSTCEPDASNLLKEISLKLAADEKARWEFQIQKHKDAVKLKEEALKIDEEDRKRQASLQKEALRIDEEDRKRQSSLQNEAQKQQYSLQKEAQKQQYALQKSDQEAGGLRGFVNSITKLKMTLWRDNSEQYLKNQKVDYSKLKFN